MGADVDEIQPVQVFSPAQRREAEERADRIRSHLASAADEYARAIIEEDWRVLGFGSLEEWRAEMFGAQRLTVEARQQVHELLSAEGMGTKEIGQATGTPQRTVQRDIGEPRHFGATPSDQAKRNADVTRKLVRAKRPKTGAQWVREHRDRKAAEPCDHSAGLHVVCKGCGKPDKAVGSSLDAIEKAHRQQVAKLEAANAELRRSVALAAAGQADPGNDTRTPQYDVSGDRMPDYEDFGDPVPDDDDEFLAGFRRR